MVFVYYAAMILLLGAEFTQVWAQRTGPGIRPSKHAVKVVQEKRHLRDDGSAAGARRGDYGSATAESRDSAATGLHGEDGDHETHAGRRRAQDGNF
jgi:membrane protein